MLPILLDRAAMGISLAIHIILASLGIALPIVMSVMEFIGIRRKDPHYTLFARRMTPGLRLPDGNAVAMAGVMQKDRGRDGSHEPTHLNMGSFLI